jgi:RecJ-like exonuclease
VINLVVPINEIRGRIDTLGRERKEAIDSINKKYDAIIAKYQAALDVNLDMNESCLHCQGKGYIRVYNGVDTESEDCPECGGSKVKDRCAGGYLK